MSDPRVLNVRGVNRAKEEANGAVYVGRPSKWGNPFHVGRDGTRQEVIERYQRWLIETGPFNDLHELKGRNLLCWCAPEPCHADVLLALAERS